MTGGAPLIGLPPQQLHSHHATAPNTLQFTFFAPNKIHNVFRLIVDILSDVENLALLLLLNWLLSVFLKMLKNI